MASATVIRDRANKAIKKQEQKKIEQTEVLRLKSRGMSNNAIAYQMNIPVARVADHLKKD